MVFLGVVLDNFDGEGAKTNVGISICSLLLIFLVDSVGVKHADDLPKIESNPDLYAV